MRKILNGARSVDYQWINSKKLYHELVANGQVSTCFKPHRLHGNRAGQWECHIQPDWLLIWEQNNTELTLLMLNTGTHFDLFGKTKR